MIILDTDVLIEIFDKNSDRGDYALEQIEQADDDIATTSLSLHEIRYGLQKYGKKKLKLLDQLEAIEFNGDNARLSSNLELECERKGKSVSRLDAMIAAIVINRNAKLFTFNKKHFENFSSLQLL